MIFNETELSVLKNFSTINASMLIRPDRLEIINDNQSCIAKYVFEKPYDFEAYGIYNLNEFLSVLGMIKNPEITVHEKYLTIKQGNTKVKYYTTPENLIPVVRSLNKVLSAAKFDMAFNLPAEKLASIFKAATVLQLEWLFFETDGKKIRLTLANKLESSDSSFEVVIDDGIKENNIAKTAKVPVCDLKLMPGDYFIEIASTGVPISRWTCFNGVQYIIGASNKG